MKNGEEQEVLVGRLGCPAEAPSLGRLPRTLSNERELLTQALPAVSCLSGRCGVTLA